MGLRKDGFNPIRKITKIGTSSYAITIPIQIVRKLKWQERQKVVADEAFGTITIKDWEKPEANKVASDATDLKRGIDHIGVTVNFFIHDGDGNVLLQKRSKNCRDEQGKWDIGGGAVEFGEELEEAVAREVKEELCATSKKLSLYKYMMHTEITPAHKHIGWQ